MSDSKNEKMETGCNCTACKTGKVIAEVHKDYHGVCGGNRPPTISLEFYCQDCGVTYKFPPHKPELHDQLLSNAYAKDHEEEHQARWANISEEAPQVLHIEMKEGQYLGTDGKVHDRK